MTTLRAPETLLAATRALAPLIRAHADQTEHERRLAPAVVVALRAAGLFRLLVPAEFGGLEVDPVSCLRLIEAVSEADGATGWAVHVSNVASFIVPYLPRAGVEAVFGATPDVCIAGSPAPVGRAVPVAGGYRISGQWPFGSEIGHADWLVVGCTVVADESPDAVGTEPPERREFFFPAAEAVVLDTWDVTGLRGTGSHHFTATDVFVPVERSYPLGPTQACCGGPLFRVPQTSLWTAAVAPVLLGIARAAITTLQELAAVKRPTGSSTVLREHSDVQAAVAQADALVRSARAFLFEVVGDLWETVQAEAPLTAEQRALVRSAAVHAAQSAVQAVDLMFNAGGGTSIYATSRLDRYLRDVHTGAQNVLVQPRGYQVAGRVLLGLDPGTPF